MLYAEFLLLCSVYTIFHEKSIYFFRGTVSEEQQEIVEEDCIRRTVKLYDLPLSAGLGVDVFDDAPSEDFATTNPKCDFALRIKGDSMEPGIPDGSIVLIHKQDSIDTGEIGAFFHNGRVYCKKRSIEDGKTLLISNNGKYLPIEIKNEDVSKCYGKVIETVSNPLQCGDGRGPKRHCD